MWISAQLNAMIVSMNITFAIQSDGSFANIYLFASYKRTSTVCSHRKSFTPLNC